MPNFTYAVWVFTNLMSFLNKDTVKTNNIRTYIVIYYNDIAEEHKSEEITTYEQESVAMLVE